MAVREIPKSFEYACDACDTKHLQENATGHYTESTPPGWSKLVFRWRNADGEFEDNWHKLLCGTCSTTAYRALAHEGIIK